MTAELPPRGHGEMRARYGQARSDPGLVALEGLHAVKHALRFGADVTDIVTAQPDRLQALATSLAGDVANTILEQAHVVDSELFAALAGRPPASPVLALAATRRRRSERLPAGRSVVLFEPRHAGNAGAAIRVAAAAGAAAVVFVGDLDPWTPAVVRAAAGLHFALDIVQATWPVRVDGPVVALDPDSGADWGQRLPDTAALVFGSERTGLPPEVLAAADATMQIPMRSGVSSLNLATAVAVALYANR